MLQKVLVGRFRGHSLFLPFPQLPPAAGKAQGNGSKAKQRDHGEKGKASLQSSRS